MPLLIPTSFRRRLALAQALSSRLLRQLRLAKALSLPALATLLLVLGTAAARTAARKAGKTTAVYTVTATAYEAVASQTDGKPFITADNSRIPRGYGSHTRWLALSRDLLRPWGGPFEFGDKVRVRGVSRQLDGVYTVHDTMNRRYHHRLDLLVHPRERITINQPGVKLERIARTKPKPVAKARLKPLRHARQLAHHRPAAPAAKKLLANNANKATASGKRRQPPHAHPTLVASALHRRR